MHYIKMGPVRIPYQIKDENGKKCFKIGKISIPFSSYEKNCEKYYRFFGISLKLPMLDKMCITQGYSNYLKKDKMTDSEIKETAIRIFQEKLGYTPNLEKPSTMNEKIFWSKLNYHNPLITKCCDKYAVKEYVEEVIGEGHVIPTIEAWDSAEAIDFTILPEKYVMKVNWSSGYNIIVNGETKVDTDKMRKQVAHWMEPQQNSYYQTFNWGYKDMKPVVYAEEYMEQFAGQLYDYKFYCCNGTVKFMFIATNRKSKETLTYDFFDRDFNALELTYGGRKRSEVPLEKPKFYEEMIRCAEALAKPFPFVRVDFYETNNNFYVGEMTFYSGGGILRFDPPQWDKMLGDYIDFSDESNT